MAPDPWIAVPPGLWSHRQARLGSGSEGAGFLLPLKASSESSDIVARFMLRSYKRRMVLQ